MTATQHADGTPVIKHVTQHDISAQYAEKLAKLGFDGHGDVHKAVKEFQEWWDKTHCDQQLALDGKVGHAEITKNYQASPDGVQPVIGGRTVTRFDQLHGAVTEATQAMNEKGYGTADAIDYALKHNLNPENTPALKKPDACAIILP